MCVLWICFYLCHCEWVWRYFECILVVWLYTGCPRKKSLIKFFLGDFPTDVDYGPTFSWTVKHPWRPGHSLKKVAGRPLASDQVSGDKVCGWSVVHVRWEVVEDKFYQRLFSGTPCRNLLFFFSQSMLLPLVRGLPSTFLREWPGLQGCFRDELKVGP